MTAIKPPVRLVSKQDCALALGVSRPALDRYIAAGLPIHSKPTGNRRQGYLIDLDQALLWYGRLQQSREVPKPPLEVRVFSAVQREWWSRLKGLMSPENLSMIRNQQLTTQDLINSARRMSRRVGNELEALADRLEAAG